MSPPPPDRFAATRWTRVLAAKARDADGIRALSDLCADYYEPVHAFIRHSIGQEDRARDLTHDFFARLLGHPALDGVEKGRGKFRSYLLGAVKHFLLDDWKRSQAEKRGSGETPDSLDDPAQDLTGPGIAWESPVPEAVYDREWAIALVNRSLEDLEDEYEEDGKGDLFQVLKPWLTGNMETSQAEIAESLSITEGSVKVAIHRLRKRYREIVSADLAQTLDQGEDLNLEMNHLIQALGAA